MAKLITPMECPDCGHEDDMDMDDYLKGDRLICSECGTRMHMLGQPENDIELEQYRKDAARKNRKGKPRAHAR
jgi:hypothetical protein